MKYRLPHEEVEFEIPDEWWNAAGASGFSPAMDAFVSQSDAAWPTIHVPVIDVQAPRRGTGVVGLREDRTISILRAFRSGIALPALQVHEEPPAGRRIFRVTDGYHRYYASVAAGFTRLPISVRPHFDWNAL